MITPNSSFLGLKRIDLSDNSQVNSGGSSNTQTLQPPVGQIYKIKYLSYLASDPSGSTAGKHYLECFIAGDTSFGSNQTRAFLIRSNTGSDVKCGEHFMFAGDDTEVPAGNSDQQALFNRGGLIASNDYPLQFDYTNDTDANQTANREFKILVEVYKEVL